MGLQATGLPNPVDTPDGFQKTANQLLLKSYLAIERALDAAAVGLAARRPHSEALAKASPGLTEWVTATPLSVT